MKLRVVAGILLIMVLFAGVISKAAAAPWRHHRHYSTGFYGPHMVVREHPAPPPVRIEGYYGGYYRHHQVYPHRYLSHRSYGGYRRWK